MPAREHPRLDINESGSVQLTWLILSLQAIILSVFCWYLCIDRRIIRVTVNYDVLAAQELDRSGFNTVATGVISAS